MGSRPVRISCPLSLSLTVLIREGSLEWRNLCDNATYKGWFSERMMGGQRSLIKGCSEVIVLCQVHRNPFSCILSWRKKKLSQKVMIFFPSCNSVKCHSELLRHIQVYCLDIRGKQKQQKQTSTFFDFRKVEVGILLCTDVAAHGLDIPDVDCMRQKVSKVKSNCGAQSCMTCMVTFGPRATYCSITFVFENVFSNLIL